MNSFVTTLRDRLSKRARYTRTLRELRALSAAEAADLGISQSEIKHIAHSSVYGN